MVISYEDDVPEFRELQHSNNLDRLVEYLSEMGRCGRHFSVHEPSMDHSYECRRATLALDICKSKKRNHGFGSAEVFWLFVEELVEALNGLKIYGLPGVWLEIPEDVFIFHEKFMRSLYEKQEESERLSALEKQLKYALHAALDHSYSTLEEFDLAEESLLQNGLELDPEIDWDDL